MFHYWLFHNQWSAILDLLAQNLVVWQYLVLKRPLNRIMNLTFNKFNPEPLLKEAVVMITAGIQAFDMHMWQNFVYLKETNELLNCYQIFNHLL